MIKLPNFNKTFEYENNFYLTCDASRIGKVIAHYELYKMAKEVPGKIIECGVFKGASLVRFAIFQKLFGAQLPKKIIGFDTFGKFPKTQFLKDRAPRKKFIDAAGEYSISKKQLMKVLKHKGLDTFVELIEGDVTKTIPLYIDSHPELKISLLNLDVDVYEPSVTILKYFYPKITKGGVLILDDYEKFPGETRAVDEYFKNQKVEINKFSFCTTPRYIIKQ